MTLCFKLVTTLLVALVVLLPARSTLAGTTSIHVQVTPQPGEVIVRLANPSKGVASKVSTEVEINGKSYAAPTLDALKPKTDHEHKIKIPTPSEPGTYAVVTRVQYDDEDGRMTVINAALLDHEQPNRLAQRPRIWAQRMRERGRITALYDKTYRFRLILPPEVEVLSTTERPDGTVYVVRNPRPTRATRYSIFGVLETKPKAGPAPPGASIAHASLSGAYVAKASSYFSPSALALIALLALLISFFVFRRSTADDKKPSELEVVFIRYTFSIFTVSLLYFLYRTAYVVPDWFFQSFKARSFGNEWFGRAAWRVLRSVIQRLYFEGGDFDHFSKLVADPAYLYILTANYFVLRYAIKPEPKKDKYWHLLRAVLSLPSVIGGRLGLGGRKRKDESPHGHSPKRTLRRSRKPKRLWTKKTKIGVLTLCVKTFYVPLLSSWAINNVVHQRSLIGDYHRYFAEHGAVTWMQVHTFVIAGLILIDVGIFAFGYLVELPQLDNQIKSVEPTLLGWVVCLMCYPPFNAFSFAPVDIPLMDSWPAFSGFWKYFALSIVAMMWAIYCWATVALGVRSSNLTHRGVVRTGPYAYVRHPAYISKTFLWAVGGFFLGERGLIMCLGLIGVYWLRAWTEERHLSMDPDYLKYKKEVPYRFIPWVF